MFVSMLFYMLAHTQYKHKNTILNVVLASKDVITLSCMTQNDKNLFFCSSGVARFKNQYYEAEIRVLARLQLQSLYLFLFFFQKCLGL